MMSTSYKMNTFDWVDTDPDAFYDVYEDNYREYCPEGWDADEEYVEFDAEWPNRGRYGTLPPLSFLTANYYPPMTKPEPLDSYVYERQEKYNTELKALETEKATLIEKAEKIEKELKEAQDVPKTYSAARWGAISARDALVKRLTTDCEDAYGKVNDCKQKINALNKGNETVSALLQTHKGVEDVYTQHIENRNKFWEEMYGKQKPLTDLKQVEWEYEADVVEETDKYVWYRFGPDAKMESCLRALAVADYNVVRVDEREFEVTKK